ncbi:hypothetical protein QBC32DRAFT_311286 [Pseudoneurospora amorphoporcata]|uniref:Uncharacterized protein n=1 Tax=Pseudoneurospora amorphoporcata TaxID=241081 RepID=A0AAN6P006_9PEZI|nr:hypothetical protein QBC32DRAFT_311286 [Pseudoneurospora amorphoporcata]
MRTSPIFTFTREVLLLGALTHLTSLALALPQSQGTPAETTKEPISRPKPFFSTIVVPTATELTTILTVVTNALGATTSNTPPTATTSTPRAASSPHCIVQEGSDGICVTVVPIWPTDTLAPVVKRQAQSQSNSETQTQTQHSACTPTGTPTTTSLTTTSNAGTDTLAPAVKRQATNSNTNAVTNSHSITYLSTALVTSLVVVHATTPLLVTTVLTVFATPTTTTATKISTSTSTTRPETSCPMPSELVNGHCTYNSWAGWNPAAVVPTEPVGPPPGALEARAVETNWAQTQSEYKLGLGLGQARQVKEERGGWTEIGAS